MAAALAAAMFVMSGPAVVSGAGGHWADATFEKLAGAGIVQAGEFLPSEYDAPITRGRFAEVFVRLVGEGAEPDGERYFTDIGIGSRHYQATAKAKLAGLITGHPDGSFRPDAPIMRQELFAIVGRVLDGGPGASASGAAVNASSGAADSPADDTALRFADGADVAGYAKAHVARLADAGVINGYGDGSIRPRSHVTCAEAMAVAARAYDALNALAATAQADAGLAVAAAIGTAATSPAVTSPAATAPAQGGGKGSPIGGGGGGGGGAPPAKDTTPPTVKYSLSTAEPTFGPVVIALDISDNTGIKKVEYGLTYVEPIFDDASFYCDTAYQTADISNEFLMDMEAPFVGSDRSDPIYSEALKYEQLCGGVNSIRLIQSYFYYIAGDYMSGYRLAPQPKMLAGRQLAATRNATYYFCVEDTAGNRTYRRVPVNNIKLAASADLDVAVTDDFSKDTVAEVRVASLSENPNAPITRLWMGAAVPDHRIGAGHGAFLYGSYSVERNFEFLSRLLFAPDENGVFKVKDLGSYILFMEDAWGNLSRMGVEISQSGNARPFDFGISQTEPAGAGGSAIHLSFEDEARIARAQYVKITHQFSGGAAERPSDIVYRYAYNPEGRQPITGNEFTVTERGDYIVCVYDIDGNVAYKSFTVR
jgi:hypothetical protein